MILRPSRQALLFLAALGAPCVLLIGLTLRLLAQERELAEKRRADDRRRLATDIRQDLIGQAGSCRGGPYLRSLADFTDASTRLFAVADQLD